MSEHITAMYARKNFGRLLDKTALLGESYVIERAGRPMAALMPIGETAVNQNTAEEVGAALENLIKKMKGDKSKKLEKAIREARKAVSRL